MTDWNPFPHASEAFDRAGAQLKKAWANLHRGDRVPFCDADWVATCIEQSPEIVPEAFDGDLQGLSARLQDAWRDFHRGAFQSAVEQAETCGVLGHAAANKAAGIYATYLEPDAETQQSVFQAAIDRAETAVEWMPFDPNSHYFLAFNLGRLSQSISVVTALRQGIGGRIQAALTKTLELQPDHAEAHTAFGMYHAEIINKVGKMLGGMTYGASADKAIEHFETALELTPEAPIAHIEYGNGLYLLYGNRKLDQVSELYEKAVELEPRDAMEKLDIEAALAEME